jgi:hypothetical protein
MSRSLRLEKILRVMFADHPLDFLPEPTRGPQRAIRWCIPTARLKPYRVERFIHALVNVGPVFVLL